MLNSAGSAARQTDAASIWIVTFLGFLVAMWSVVIDISKVDRCQRLTITSGCRVDDLVGERRSIARRSIPIDTVYAENCCAELPMSEALDPWSASSTGYVRYRESVWRSRIR